MPRTHNEIRETIEWGSYGKNGDEPLTKRLIKDISNSHLDKIIPFIKRNLQYYGNKMLQIMINEQNYRNACDIFVPDYNQIKKLTFLKRK